MSETDHHRSLARFARTLAALDAGLPTPARLCEAGRRMLGGDGAGLTIGRAAASSVLLHSTDAVTAEIDDLQEVTGDGPSVRAVASREVVVLTVEETDGEAGVFVDRLATTGFRGTVIAVPLLVQSAVVGVLVTHRRGGERPDDRSTGTFLGATFGPALLHDQLGQSPESGPDPWERRAVVHQATGMVVAQVGVGAADALALLRGQAFARNLHLNDVAREIVDRRINFRDFTIEGD